MGEAADMMLDGILCQVCGEWTGAEEPSFHPITCDGCREDDFWEEDDLIPNVCDPDMCESCQ